MNYQEELWELYKLAGMQRPMNCVQIQSMDSTYSSLLQVISKLSELGIKSYADLDKLKVDNNTDGE